MSDPRDQQMPASLEVAERGAGDVREHPIGPAAEFGIGERRVFALRGAEVGVFRLADRFVAYENVCPHQGGPVCEGLLLGKVEAVVEPDRTISGERFSEEDPHIICPWHGYEYSAATGRCAHDERFSLRPVEVVERGGELYVVA